MHDTVYYWKPDGTSAGRWYPTLITADQIDDTLASLRTAGYHALPGTRSIGAPEGAPRWWHDGPRVLCVPTLAELRESCTDA
jgi:hypothetical protein